MSNNIKAQPAPKPSVPVFEIRVLVHSDGKVEVRDFPTDHMQMQHILMNVQIAVQEFFMRQVQAGNYSINRKAASQLVQVKPQIILPN